MVKVNNPGKDYDSRLYQSSEITTVYFNTNKVNIGATVVYVVLPFVHFRF